MNLDADFVPTEEHDWGQNDICLGYWVAHIPMGS